MLQVLIVVQVGIPVAEHNLALSEKTEKILPIPGTLSHKKVGY